ncbi:hypothetical protein ACIQVC_18830 [Streptomyces sp. NPDC101112]|uniref:hypothetical protein n=1 Tax=Streptomyces sp. NPDC101112 TaxID=3366105 RepID=UPI00381C52FE
MSAAADVSPTVRGTGCDTPIEEWLETDLHVWTRKVVARHLHPETGSPYWLRRAARLDFAPRDITRYQRLTAFGPFPSLRSQDPADLVPLAVPRPLTGPVRDTGGPTGTQLSPDMYRDFEAAMDGGICGRSYGNTLGNAAGPPVEQNAEIVPYAPDYPQVTMNVVRKEDWSTAVEYGTVGEVRLTVPHEDLFLPHILERDQAPRYDTDSRWPSDGVANVTPLRTTSSAP